MQVVIMSNDNQMREEDIIFHEDNDYVHSRKESHKAAVKHIPMLTKLATAVNNL